MKDALETYEYRGLRIEVHADDSPESPREWDNLGTMVCWHRRYNLGDEQPSESAEAYIEGLVSAKAGKRLAYLEECTAEKSYTIKQWDKVNDAIEMAKRKIVEDDLKENLIILPLYLYDHGGITMSTGRFSCPWDSGQVGFIYISLKDAQKNWTSADKSLGWDAPVFYEHDKTTKTLRERARAVLESEVKVYDDYLTGSVYGYVVASDGDDHIDSCWGFFGADECKWHDEYDKCGHMMQCARDAADAHLKHSEEMDTQLCMNI